MYACEICNKLFSTNQRLKTHHERKNKCSNINIKKQINIDFNNFPHKNEGDFEEKSSLTKMSEQFLKIVKSDENSQKNKIKEEFKCEYCKKVYNRKDNLNRHVEKYCKSKNDFIHKNILENILDKVKELECKSIIQNNTTNNNNNTTNNNINITNNIINFNDLNYDVDDSFMYQCLKNGFHGDIDYLKRVYIESIPSDSRPVKCLDPSRDKCVVRKNGEWIASTGKDIYRQSLKRIVDNYLRVNNSMIDDNEDRNRDNIITNHIYSNCNDRDSIDEDYKEYNDEYIDIQEYLNHYEAENNSTNEKMDEYVDNLNRITKMMEEKNVERVRKHMNILLK